MAPIIIGRSPEYMGNGQQKQTISDKSVSRSHAHLTQIGPDKWKLRDIGSTFGTFVNGLPTVEAEVGSDDSIIMGNFETSVRKLLGLATNKPGSAQTPVSGTPQGQKAPVEYVSVRHLEAVYNEYQDALKRIQKEKQKSQLVRMLPTSLGIPVVIGVLGMFDISPVVKGVSMVGILGLGAILTLRMFPQFSQHVDEQFDLNQQFQIDYVCPKCKNFFGVTKPYKALINQGKCPYCKSEFRK